MQSETTIAGQATLAFARDKSWFQGNVISPEKDAYTVSGRRIGNGREISFTSSSNSSPSSSSPIAIGMTMDSSSLMSKKSMADSSMKGMADSPSHSPSVLPRRKGMIDSCCSSSREDSPTIARSPSEVDSLDSELIERTLASIDNEEEEVGYEMAIMDYETGMNHSPQVRVTLSATITMTMVMKAICKVFEGRWTARGATCKQTRSHFHRGVRARAC